MSANTTLDNILQPLATALADIADKIATLQLEEAALKSKIRETVPGPDSYAAGNLTVTVSSNRRFDQKKALAAIPEDLIPLVSERTWVVDRKRVEVICDGATLQNCFTEFDYRIAIK
jgi:hypothetical protein